VIDMTTAMEDRYIGEVARRVPDQVRKSVDEQLRARIDDSVAKHRTLGLSRDEALARTLTELGDPADLAVSYGGHPRYLIGPDHYREYVQLLRLLMVAVLPTVGAVMLVVQGMTGAAVLDVLTNTLAVVFQVGVQLALWVTVAFAIMDRYGKPQQDHDWTPADLPEPVDRRIGLGDTVVSIALLAVLMWAILWQRDHWLITVDGAQVPALDPAAWSPWILLLLAVVALSIVLEVVKHRVGQWTVTLATVNTALNVAFATIVLWLWGTDSLLNPVVATSVGEGVTTLIGGLPWVILLICGWDTVDGWWRALRG
jgi:hypothetical protein